MRSVVGVTLLVSAVLGVRPASAQGAAPSTRLWWRVPSVVQQLALTDAQAASIESVYQASLPQRRELRAREAALEQELQRLLADPAVSDDVAMRAAATAAAAQARANVARTLLLVEIRKILTPTQRRALTALRLADARTAQRVR